MKKHFHRRRNPKREKAPGTKNESRRGSVKLYLVEGKRHNGVIEGEKDRWRKSEDIWWRTAIRQLCDDDFSSSSKRLFTDFI